MTSQQEATFNHQMKRYRETGFLSVAGCDYRAISGYKKDQREFEEYKRQFCTKAENA